MKWTIEMLWIVVQITMQERILYDRPRDEILDELIRCVEEQ